MFYAIKSNPIEPLLNDMTNYETGFDCASKGEIKTVLKLGTSPDRIVLSNSIKKEEDIGYAAKKGVRLTTADTIDELIKIQKIDPTMEILWRISIKEENSGNLATIFSNKFGDDISNIAEAEARFK